MNEKRQTGRAKSLLAARLQVRGVSHGVTVRNVSETGALVETPHPPGLGTSVLLSRGELAVAATVAWARAGECGLHFDAPIDLSQWLPTTGRSSGQAQVDAALKSIRAGEPTMERAFDNPPIPSDALTRHISDELGYIARLLETLGDELAEDRAVAARHGTKLQNLDIAIQILGHIGNVIGAADPQAAVAAIGMADLRRRLERKSL